MKKTFLLILLLSLGSNLVYSQMKQGVFVFGPKVGVQTIHLGVFGDRPEDFNSKLQMSFQGGVFTRLNLGKISLQPEFLYSQKGGAFEEPQEKHTYKYLSTPIILGVEVLDGVHFEIGPEFSWSTNTNWKKANITQYGPTLPTDRAVVVGTRFDMLDMFSMFSMNIRYTHGLVNTNTREIAEFPLDLRTRTIQLSVTYNFSEYYKWWRKFGLKKNK